MRKKKILVIEDETMLREEICEILEFEGFEVFSAENGAVGMTTTLRHQPDLILCDIMMPVMDGNQFLESLRSNESTVLIPFIYMSALAERDKIRHGMDLGADDYLTKPFSRDELIQAIDTRFKRQKAIQEQKELALNNLRNRIITRLPHELRTPLSGIIGFGSLLKDMSDSFSPAEIADIGNEILESGNRLLRLIENYLIYVQLQLSEQKSEVIAGDKFVALVIETAQRVAKINNRENKLKLMLQKSEAVPLPEYFIQKIIQEITDNALRFSSRETEVLITGVPKNKQYLLTITDKGRGLTEEQMSQIGAYMQFDREIQEQQGSGLGLIIAKKMVEVAGGEFMIDSQLGKGTTIKIYLPKESKKK